jgi:hypothetical protein
MQNSGVRIQESGVAGVTGVLSVSPGGFGDAGLGERDLEGFKGTQD